MEERRFMSSRGLSELMTLAVVLMLAACGGGSGRGGTDVAVSGSGPTAVVAGGDTVAFVFDVENAGANDARDLVLVNQAGEQLTIVGVDCAPASAAATCPVDLGPSMSVPSLPARSALRFTINARVASGASGTLVDSFSVNFSEDLDRSNNSVRLTATAYSPQSDLVAGGAGPSQTVAAGGSAVFTMTLRNEGPDAASDVAITNEVGSNLSLVDIRCTAEGGASCPAILDASMRLSTMPAGGLLTFTVSANVNAGAADGRVVNQLTARSETDTDRSDNEFLALAEVRTPRAGLSVSTLAVPKGPVPAGGAAAFVMQVANGGPDAATDVRIVDTVSGNLSFRAATCSASGGAICPAVMSPSMSVATMPAGSVLTFTVNTVADADADGAITNTLTVSSVEDIDRTDNTATAVGMAFATAVSVDVRPPAPMLGGASGEFTVVVANAGPSAAAATPLSITLDAALSVAGTIRCTAAGGSVCPTTTGLAMVVPSIGSGGAVTFSVPVVVTAGFNGNAALAASADVAGDARPSDDADTVTVAVSSADVGTSMSAAATQTGAGGTVVFTATVGNPGPSTASELTLRHQLAGAGAAGASAAITCSASAGASCPVVGATMTVPALAANRSLTFTITVPVGEGARGAVTSTLTVESAGDPSSTNNSASATSTVVDPRNGVYTVFRADGVASTLTADFDAPGYGMDGAALQPLAGSGSEFTVGGVPVLRTSGDLIVGRHDFGSGPVAYVAARRFIDSVGSLQGAYNLGVRNGGATSAGSAAITGDGRLFLCEQASGLPVAVSQCPSGSLRVYALTAAGETFTATPLEGGAGLRFQVAASAGARFILMADSGTFRIGPSDPPALAGGNLRGPDTSGQWQAVMLTIDSYASTDLASVIDSAALSPVAGYGASSMRIGFRGSDGARIYVMQAGDLAVVLGHPADVASGLMQFVAR
jgi:uncharacterized repeat protein (TIGR01451 family)